MRQGEMKPSFPGFPFLHGAQRQAMCQQGAKSAAKPYQAVVRRESVADGAGRAPVFLTQACPGLDHFLHHVRSKYVISAKHPACPAQAAGAQTVLSGVAPRLPP
jgi:hypothetical protein